MIESRTIDVTCSYCGKTFKRYYSLTINPKTGQPRKKAKCPDCKRVDPKVLFWQKVDKTSSPNGCWIWTGAKHPEGYGQFVNPSLKDIRAHRISWIFERGEIPEGLKVLHKCPGTHNRSCVNPEHLYLGTQADNIRDAVEQGTYNRPHGTNAYNAILTDDAVREIRRDYRYGTGKILAAKFGVKVCTVRDVANHKSWKHVS